MNLSSVNIEDNDSDNKTKAILRSNMTLCGFPISIAHKYQHFKKHCEGTQTTIIFRELFLERHWINFKNVIEMILLECDSSISFQNVNVKNYSHVSFYPVVNERDRTVKLQEYYPSKMFAKLEISKSPYASRVVNLADFWMIVENPKIEQDTEIICLDDDNNNNGAAQEQILSWGEYISSYKPLSFVCSMASKNCVCCKCFSCQK
jgi:hypothetical protein